MSEWYNDPDLEIVEFPYTKLLMKKQWFGTSFKMFFTSRAMWKKYMPADLHYMLKTGKNRQIPWAYEFKPDWKYKALYIRLLGLEVWIEKIFEDEQKDDNL